MCACVWVTNRGTVGRGCFCLHPVLLYLGHGMFRLTPDDGRRWEKASGESFYLMRGGEVVELMGLFFE